MVAEDEVGELIGRLANEAVIERLPDGLLFLSWDGERLDPPLRFTVSPDQIGRRVRENAADAVGLFDDSPKPNVNHGWALFIVHLQEAIDTRAAGHSSLRLTRHGIRAE